MDKSTAPDWLVELIGNQMRLMSSSPQSVADSVWWALQNRIAIELKESLDFRTQSIADSVTLCAEGEFRLVDREDAV